ncbi:MAG: hypothetical protein JWM41_3836 [Gemmatimonadetes bacterium]|nr:hypothetical protein [Gemmatimonadota bacterium]
MRHHIRRTLGLAAAVLLVAASAHAQGRGHDKGKGDEHGKAKGEDVRVPDANVIVQSPGVRGGRGIPPGLAKKPGQMPPGQYKKLYSPSQGADALSGVFRDRGYTVTRVVPSGNSQYVYYRLRNGTEHRAIVRPGTNQLSFSNVPSSLLQQVLARLH